MLNPEKASANEFLNTKRVGILNIACCSIFFTSPLSRNEHYFVKIFSQIQLNYFMIQTISRFQFHCH